MTPDDSVMNGLIVAACFMAPGAVLLVVIVGFRSWLWRTRLREISRWFRH